MTRAAWFNDSAGHPQKVIAIWFNDSGGHAKKCIAAWVKDSHGNVHQWWPPPGGTIPPVQHTATAAAHIVRGVAHWSIPSGRHVTHQTLTYFTGLHTHPQKHTVNVSAGARSHSVLAGAWGATVRYTYT